MKNIKKYILLIAFFAVLILPNFASAQSLEELQAKMADLLKQLSILKTQIAQLQSTTSQWCHDFNVNLRIGTDGPDIEALQTVLEKEGFSISQSEKSNREFNESTASAITGFQEKYKDDVLYPIGLKYGTGYAGKATREKLNKLYGCYTGTKRQSSTQTQTTVPAIPVSTTPVTTPTSTACIQVITPAKNPSTGECVNFSTPCEVKAGWEKVNSCPISIQSPATLKPAIPSSVIGTSIHRFKPIDPSRCPGTIETSCTLEPANIIKVSVYDEKGGYIDTRENTNSGMAGFVNLPYGNYIVVIDAEGFAYYKAPFTICATCEETTTIFLKKASVNQPPVINSIAGPTSLKLNEGGVWTVKASDPENGPLSYFVTWGGDQSVPMARQESLYSQSVTFSHSYSFVGIYTVTFSVVDEKGLSARKTITVQVTSEIAPIGMGPHSFQIVDSDSCRCTAGTACQTCPQESGIIRNAQIVAYDSKGNIVGSRETTSGMAVFENLPYGTYSVIIRATGYETDKGEFTICPTCGENTTLFLQKSQIEKKSIAIVSPNGGEKLLKGSTYTLRWNSSGINTIYIKLRKGSDTYVGSEGMVSDVILNSGLYHWTVPTTLPDGNDYAIRVIDGTFGGPLDDSDATFSITSGAISQSQTVGLADILESVKGVLQKISDALKE